MENLCILCDVPTNLYSNLKKYMDAHFDAAWKMPTPGPITRIQSLDDVATIVDELIQKACITQEQEQELKELVEKYKKREIKS